MDVTGQPVAQASAYSLIRLHQSENEWEKKERARRHATAALAPEAPVAVALPEAAAEDFPPGAV